jgi:hypothetical protein
VYFSSRTAGVLIQEMARGDAALANETLYGPIGLQYTGPDGEPYLVPDIFDMGAPVPMVLPAGEDDGILGDPAAGDADDLTGFPRLLANYPNPFNPTTTIPFELASRDQVTLRIYDARGALVRTLKNETFPRGVHQAVWDGRDDRGLHVATGVYFVRLVTRDVVTTRKIVMIK